MGLFFPFYVLINIYLLFTAVYILVQRNGQQPLINTREYHLLPLRFLLRQSLLSICLFLSLCNCV